MASSFAGSLATPASLVLAQVVGTGVAAGSIVWTPKASLTGAPQMAIVVGNGDPATGSIWTAQGFDASTRALYLKQNATVVGADILWWTVDGGQAWAKAVIV